MGILQRSTALTGANVVAFAYSLGVVTALPAWAGATRVVSDLDVEDRPVNVILAQVKRTFVRDWWLSLATVVAFGLGAVSLVTAWGWFTGWRQVLILVLLAVVHLTLGVLVVSYTRSAGTLPLGASRGQVMDQAMRRVVEYPGRSLLSALAVVVCLPLWVLAPLAIAFGIVLPLWLVHRIWAPIEVQVEEDDPLCNDEEADDRR